MKGNQGRLPALSAEQMAPLDSKDVVVGVKVISEARQPIGIRVSLLLLVDRSSPPVGQSLMICHLATALSNTIVALGRGLHQV